MQNLQVFKFKTIFFLLLLCAFQKATAQTALVAGDIAFTGYIGNGTVAGTDQFSFVLLKAIVANTVVNFTDNAWLRTSPTVGSFTTIEGTTTWTSNAAYPVGTEITILVDGANAKLVSGANAGTLTTSIALSLSANGDQIIAYQGTTASPTFITAIHMNVYNNGIPAEPITDATNWDGSYSTLNASGLPSNLTTGTNAIWIGTQGDINSEKDNARFNCSGTLTTVAGIKAAIFNKANWTTSDNAPGFTLPTLCNFFSVLPVELLNFQAKNTEGGTFLTWQTASEKDNKGFHVQHSSGGKAFETIGFVKGFGTSLQTQSYSFIDAKPFKSIAYYRLKQVDYDGRTDYSNIISIQNKGASKVKIYPTKTNGELTIDGANSFEITNMNGQVVFARPSNNERSFTIAHLPSGIYIIKGLDTEGGNFLEKIMVVQ